MVVVKIMGAPKPDYALTGFNEDPRGLHGELRRFQQGQPNKISTHCIELQSNRNPFNNEGKTKRRS
jgi:hypothetical protein